MFVHSFKPPAPAALRSSSSSQPRRSSGTDARQQFVVRVVRAALVVGARHLRQLAAVLHDDDLVADRAHGVQVVADEQVGHAELAPQLGQQVEHRGADDGVERRGHLVAQDQVGLGGQRAREVDALLLAARQPAGQRGRPACAAASPGRAARRCAAAAARRCRPVIELQRPRQDALDRSAPG